jgi:hypothetical protein
MAAKACRLLRAIMTAADDDDEMLPTNPCRIKGAGDEHATERNALTVRQVFDQPGRVGTRPIGKTLPPTEIQSVAGHGCDARLQGQRL